MNIKFLKKYLYFKGFGTSLIIGILSLFSIGQIKYAEAQIMPINQNFLDLPLLSPGVACQGKIDNTTFNGIKTYTSKIVWTIKWNYNIPNKQVSSWKVTFKDKIWSWTKGQNYFASTSPQTDYTYISYQDSQLPLDVSFPVSLVVKAGDSQSDNFYPFNELCKITIPAQQSSSTPQQNTDLLKLEQDDFIATPTYETSPSFSIKSFSSGTLTYGGDCGNGDKTSVSGAGIHSIKYQNLIPKIYNNCTITLKNGNQEGASLMIKPFEILSSGSDPNLDLVEIEPVPFQSNEKSPSVKILTKSDGDLSYSGACGNGDLKKSSQSNVYTIKFNNLTAGTYSNCSITLSKNNKSGKAMMLSKFIIIDNGQGGANGNNNNNNNQNSNNGNSNQNNQSPNNSVNTNTTNDKPELAPSPDIMNCKKRADILFFENDKPAYDYFSVDCNLTQGAIIYAEIHNSSFDPKTDDHSGSLVKVVKSPVYFDKSKFSATWGGYDDFDQEVELGNYKFVVYAKLGDGFKPDISIQNFKIENIPEKEDSTPDSNENLHPSENKKEVINEGEQLNIIDEENKDKQKDKILSQCPNIFYPKDIAGHPLEDIIKKAYDRCLVKGYEDGSFRPAQGLTRAEATKIIVLATGNVAKQGCYDEDCGSPFMDLDMWQGPWVRAAWDKNFVSGVGKDKFAPNLNITKGEAAALILKSFKIPPFVGCYTANCGAGHPDNFFKDIVKNWQGQYLRPLWDKKIISADSQGFFYPDMPISRSEILNWIFKVNPDSGNSKTNLPTVVPPSTAK